MFKIAIMRKINLILMTVFCLLSLNSCWEKRYFLNNSKREYLGNPYKEMQGKTKNQILQAMSAPDRITEDGMGGEIMVYENFETVTTSSGYSSSSSSSASGAVAGYDRYGRPAAVGVSQTSGNSGYNSQTVTQNQKSYVNFFVDKNGVCYKVNTNIGDRYTDAPTECYKTANSSVLWWLMPPFTPIGIGCFIWYEVNKNKMKPCK